jgi:hypothetical protein
MPARRSTAQGASSVYCSVHDLALFGMFHLKDHLASQKRILSDSSIEQMQAPSLTSGGESQYGMSWWVQKDLNGFQGVLAQGGTNDATAYLQLIPSEDLAVAMLLNTGIPDGARIVDEVLAALLPQYGSNPGRAVTNDTSVPSSSQRQGPYAAVVGDWSGFVQTYNGDVPLVLSVSASGELTAGVGAQPAVHRALSTRFATNVVWWTMPRSLGVEGEPFNLAVELHLYGGVLAGAATTIPVPSNPNGFRASYWVRLRKK